MYTRMILVNRNYRQNFEPFLAGVIVGVVGSLIIMSPLSSYGSNLNFLTRSDYNTQDSHDESIGPEISVGNHPETDPFHVMTNTSLAEQLHDKVKILCWIMTGPKNHQTKAIHVKKTWGARCNHLVFMSTEEDPYLGSVALPVVEDRNHLWQKTKEAMKYVYQNYYDKADWFFKADDDTYAVMENMRYLLSSENSSEPVYFGCKFKPYVEQGYMSGGAGYVLSKEALKRFVNDALPDETKCKKADTGAEDVEIGHCLQNVGVKAGDSRDEEGRNRFMPLFVTNLLIPDYLPKDFWYWQYMYYPQKKGMECCSDSAITIHYVSPNEMYLMEYLIYHVKPFGIAFNPRLDLKLYDHRNHNHGVKTIETDSKTSDAGGMMKYVKTSKNGEELSWDDFN